MGALAGEATLGNADDVAAAVAENAARTEPEEVLSLLVPKANALEPIDGERSDIGVMQQFPEQDPGRHYDFT